MKEGSESEKEMEAEVSVKEPWEEEFMQPLKAGIDEEMDSAWHPGGTEPWQHLDFCAFVTAAVRN